MCPRKWLNLALSHSFPKQQPSFFEDLFIMLIKAFLKTALWSDNLPIQSCLSPHFLLYVPDLHCSLRVLQPVSLSSPYILKRCFTQGVIFPWMSNPISTSGSWRHRWYQKWSKKTSNILGLLDWLIYHWSGKEKSTPNKYKSQIISITSGSPAAKIFTSVGLGRHSDDRECPWVDND